MKRLFFIILWIGSAGFSYAQELHSKAHLIQDHRSFVQGLNVGVQLEIEQGWHAYWENPGDVGAPPQMQITSPVSIAQSDLNYPIPVRMESNPYDSFGYEHEALFYKTISLGENAGEPTSVHLNIQFDWLVCKEICVPCTKTFALDLPVDADAKADDSRFKYFSFPKRSPDIQTSISSDSKQIVITIQSSLIKKSHHADFFPSLSMKEIFNKPIASMIDNGKAVFHYPPTRTKPTTAVAGLLKLDAKEAYWVGEHAQAASTLLQPVQKPSRSLLYIFLLAFLGGVLLNLMPCVLPVVSLKLLSLMKATHEKKQEIRISNFWYTAGICVSMIGFALIFLVIQVSGAKLGWGFQLQSPTFVTLLILLFFVIGLNLIGFFEIQSIPIPGLGKLLAPESWTSDFLAGFFTTVVATPCTAPFMAVAIGFALTQNSWIIVATFLSLGLGLGFPYLLLSIFPNMVHIIPKPGAWMITFKEFLAFPMFLTVAWLTWVLSQLTDDSAVLSTLTGLTLIFLFFWAKKKIFLKQPLQKKILLLLILTSIFFTLRFPFMKKMDEQIVWETFDSKKIEAEAKNAMIFVDFTADWCLTCKTNERITFTDEDVLKIIETSHIKMIKADWTRRNPEITTILQQYNRAGVPFYLLYKPTLTTPVVLPTLLTPSIFINAVTNKGDQP